MIGYCQVNPLISAERPWQMAPQTELTVRSK